MANYNLAYGGQRTSNPGINMLPAVAPLPDDVMETDARKGDMAFSNTRWLTFPGSALSDSCFSCGGAQCADSRALRAFVCDTPILQGDSIDTHIIPRFSSVERIWWQVLQPLVGASYTLEFRDTTDNNTNVPIPIAGGVINGALASSGLILLPTPVYFPQNGFLRLTFTSLPAAPVAPTCQNCAIGGQTEGVSLLLSPIIWEYCRGAF